MVMKTAHHFRVFFPQINTDSGYSHTHTKKKKTLAPWKNSYDKPRQCIEKQRHYFANKGLYSESHDFFSSHVRM